MSKFFLKVIRFIPVVVWMSVIFYFSSTSTADISTGPVSRLIFFKSLHIIEYAILAFLMYFAIKNYLFSGIFSYFYALSDEFHQTFISGRSGQFSDTLIDLVGIILSLIIISTLSRIRNNKSIKFK